MKMFLMQVEYGDLRRGEFYSGNLDFMVKTKLRILTGEFHPLSIKEIYSRSKNTCFVFNKAGVSSAKKKRRALRLAVFSFDLCFCVLFI
ncbi:MAG TPA: hypothetical protein VF644_08160 [Pyrinomonadaceae bacterium]|jgi:hypothetical protein